MVKQYEGSGIYHLHFTSGLSIKMHEDDISELVDYSEEIESLLNKVEVQDTIIRDMEGDNELYNNAIESIKEALNELELLK